jgi:hypothetical protein
MGQIPPPSTPCSLLVGDPCLTYRASLAMAPGSSQNFARTSILQSPMDTFSQSEWISVALMLSSNNIIIFHSLSVLVCWKFCTQTLEISGGATAHTQSELYSRGNVVVTSRINKSTSALLWTFPTRWVSLISAHC